MEEQVYTIEHKGKPWFMVSLHENGDLEIMGDGDVQRINVDIIDKQKVIISKPEKV